MEKFMLLIRQDLNDVAKMTEDEYLVKLNKMLEWVDELGQSGNYIAAEPLTTVGRYVTNSNVLSDGPFIEAKEAISGYFIVQAEHIDQAVALAQNCPLLPAGEVEIEVRPIRPLV
jgi:hypothetical protein